MGQKANPTSLRLKKTNQSFSSCWYSDIYYSKLLSQEFRARQYLSNIFNQIKYPHPHLSFSLLPKKTRAMAIYLNPNQSRYRRCERFQLKLVQGTSSVASHLSRCTDSQYLPDLLLPTTIDVCPLGNPAREKRSFIHRLLLSIAIRKGTGERLAWRKDFELFQKLHRLTWFQGREESSSFFYNKQQPINTPSIVAHRRWAENGQKMGRRWAEDGQRWAIRNTTYNTSQTLQKPIFCPSSMGSDGQKMGGDKPHLRSTKVISGNSIGSERREFSTFFDSRVFTPCSSLPITGITSCLASQARSNPSDHHQMSTRIASNGQASQSEATGGWQGVQKGHPTHQQNLLPKLPVRSKDQIHVNLLESTIEKGVGCSINLCFYKSTEDGQAASFLSEEIAYYLERRVPFRRIKQLLLRELRTDYIEGVRVNCSGRVGGRSKKAQRARGEKFQWGQTSSHVFSSRLAFASRSALTSFGKVGIKVWVCYK